MSGRDWVGGGWNPSLPDAGIYAAGMTYGMLDGMAGELPTPQTRKRSFSDSQRKAATAAAAAAAAAVTAAVSAGRQFSTRRELELPACRVGAIIGKGGSHIALLRTTSGASIDLAPPAASASAAAPRSCLVSGTAEQVELAVELIRSKLTELERAYPGATAAQAAPQAAQLAPPGLSGAGGGGHLSGHLGVDGGAAAAVAVAAGLAPPAPPAAEFFEVRLSVPQHKVRGLIGKGGETINALRKESGATIIVASDCEVQPGSSERRQVTTPPRTDDCAVEAPSIRHAQSRLTPAPLPLMAGLSDSLSAAYECAGKAAPWWKPNANPNPDPERSVRVRGRSRAVVERGIALLVGKLLDLPGTYDHRPPNATPAAGGAGIIIESLKAGMMPTPGFGSGSAGGGMPLVALPPAMPAFARGRLGPHG